MHNVIVPPPLALTTSKTMYINVNINVYISIMGYKMSTLKLAGNHKNNRQWDWRFLEWG